jgi:drug/metabolite transporter (DMT)-like permease
VKGTRLLLATCVALAGFAANSLLCRKALGAGRIDAASFTTLRIAAGAAALVALASLGRKGGGAPTKRAGSTGSAVALLVYALAFSIAYLRIGAGVGALVLFAAVQLTMIGVSIARGAKPTRAEWTGLFVAAAGLVALQLPGARAPDLRGVVLMALAGAAWGIYSLRGGRGAGASTPLLTTAGNFVRALPLAVGASLLWLLLAEIRVTSSGALLAIVSGAITSGICYAFWYAALPGLGATRAAIVQLSVPALAAAGGVLFLGEAATTRVVLCGAAILGGVAIAVLGRRRG